MSEWNDQHTAIHTDVTVAVEEAIKGSPEGEVTFRVAGGIVGDTGMRTSTDPAFQEGEQVIVFLNTAVVPARVAGHFQGKNTVQNGTVIRDGQKRVGYELYRCYPRYLPISMVAGHKMRGLR